MPKINVNEATREELVEAAGLRPDLADAILKFRGRHGGKITDVNTLEELPGVGPATVEQLRKALDFSDKGEKAGNGKAAAKEGEKSAGETAEKAADVASSAARGGAEVVRGAADTGVRTASAVTREGLQVVQRAAGAVDEVQRETTRQSAEGAAELGKLWMDLLNEQTRANLEFATAFGRAVAWEEVVRIQGAFVRESFERANELNRRYLEIVRSVMAATASATRDKARKAA